MFVKYSAGRHGIENYLETGQSKTRNFNRLQLDDRVILNSSINKLTTTLSYFEKKKTNGNNYKHFVITFKEDNIKIDTLKLIDQDFKKFICNGYKADELLYYSEIHYPKIAGYVGKNNLFINRKPHIHVVIPVYNLYTGNKGFNFNYHTLDFETYLKAFSILINQKYNLASPYVNINKNLLSNNSFQIEKKSGKIFENINTSTKTRLLELIIQKNISNKNELIKLIENSFSYLKINKGDLNKNIIILRGESHKEIVLKDWCFTEDFLSLPLYEKKILYLNHKNKYFNDLENIKPLTKSELTDSDINIIKNWEEYGARLLKYSKIIKKEELKNLLDATPNNKIVILNKIEREFYDKNRNREFIRFKNDTTIINIRKNIGSIVINNRANESIITSKFEDIRKSEHKNIDQNLINKLDKKLFLILLEMYLGIPKSSIQIKTDFYLYQNKKILTNLALINLIPLSILKKSEFILDLKTQELHLKRVNHFFQNNKLNGISFYLERNLNNLSKKIIDEYSGFNSLRKKSDILVNSIIGDLNYKIPNPPDFKHKIDEITSKYFNLSKLQKDLISKAKLNYLAETKINNSIFRKEQRRIKTNLIKGVFERTIIEKQFIAFLIKMLNEKKLDMIEKKEIVFFIVINQILNSNTENILNLDDVKYNEVFIIDEKNQLKTKDKESSIEMSEKNLER